MGSATMCQIKVGGVGGVLFVVIGAVFLGSWSKLYDFVLYKQVVITESSYVNGLWEDFPIPLYMDFYFFNWTNPEDFLHEDPNIAKPKFTEMGPYIFREARKKVILDRNDGYTVTFQQNKTWVFEPSLSSGSLDDLVTTINIVAVAAAFVVRNYPLWIKILLNEVFLSFKSKLHITKTVNEYIFDGYQDPVLDLYHLLPEGFLPLNIPLDKFGLFYTRNGSETYEGVYEMFTGKGNMSRFAQLARWNNENPSHYFELPCGKMKGSAGELFPPRPKKEETMPLFVSDICRTIDLNFKEEVTFDGIEGYRYWGDEHVFDNVSVRNETWCYCPSGPCAPHGLIDISPCKWGIPAFMSFPHFLHADPYYRQAVDGMNPVEKVHQLYVDLDKRTGIPMKVEGSLQLNFLVQPMQEYELLSKVPTVYFPFLWFSQRATIDDKLGKLLRLVSRIPTAGYLLFGGFVCIGLIILAVTGAFYYHNFRRKRGGETDA